MGFAFYILGHNFCIHKTYEQPIPPIPVVHITTLSLGNLGFTMHASIQPASPTRTVFGGQQTTPRATLLARPQSESIGEPRITKVKNWTCESQWRRGARLAGPHFQQHHIIHQKLAKHDV